MYLNVRARSFTDFWRACARERTSCICPRYTASFAHFAGVGVVVVVIDVAATRTRRDATLRRDRDRRGALHFVHTAHFAAMRANWRKLARLRPRRRAFNVISSRITRKSFDTGRAHFALCQKLGTAKSHCCVRPHSATAAAFACTPKCSRSRCIAARSTVATLYI